VMDQDQRYRRGDDRGDGQQHRGDAERGLRVAPDGGEGSVQDLPDAQRPQRDNARFGGLRLPRPRAIGPRAIPRWLAITSLRAVAPGLSVAAGGRIAAGRWVAAGQWIAAGRWVGAGRWIAGLPLRSGLAVPSWLALPAWLVSARRWRRRWRGV